MPGSDRAIRRCDLAGYDGVGVVRQELAVGPQLDAEPQPLAGIACHPGLEARSPSAPGWGSSARCRSRWRGPAPARPSARCRWCAGYQIECGSSCQSCLPRGFARSAGSSSARTTSVCVPGDEQIGDVGRERRVAAFVANRERAVDPHGRGVVHGAEVEEQALAPPQPRGLEGAAVPAPGIEARVMDAARRRLGRERHHDRGVPVHLPGRPPAGLGIEGELPGPVERRPGGALHQGPGMAMAGLIDRGLGRMSSGHSDDMSARGEPGKLYNPARRDS